ncbi:MAG: hypothetical protein DRQ99_18595 [Candidatus Parabeggiatoa sp. nov. 3]|nr:MAG: hypothetical protein DRQ99_18595 [Gammaproteobacteria bacterium]
MNFPGIAIGFTSFLRDCHKENLAFYLQQLTDSITKYHQHPWHKRCLRTEDFFNLNQEILKGYEAILHDISVNRFHFDYWEFSLLPCEYEMYLREGNFSISISLNHFPNIKGLLGIRYFGDLNEISHQTLSNKYKPFVIEGLQTGLFDLAFYDNKRLGKRKWLYFEEKIWKIKSLQPFDGRMTRYDQMDKPFKLVEEYLSSIPFMEQLKELSFDKKEGKKFLRQHDQLLLSLWGSQEFADKLKPLDVSLKEWLKAV